MKHRLLQTTLAALLALGLSTLTAADKKNILMIAGKPSHGAGQHEHNAGVQLLAKCLRESGLPLDVTFHLSGEWPSDDAIAKADTILIYSDGGGGHPALQGDRLTQLGKEMKRGCGFVCLHYAVEPTTDKGNKEFQEWLGGCFETHWSVNPHWDANFTALPQHVISSGVQPFTTNDEWYFHMRFRPDMKGVTPILSAVAPESTMGRPDGSHSGNPTVREQVKSKAPQHVAWAVQRDDGGRGFGFSGGHFHKGWGNNDQRKLVLNAIVWSAKGEVPADGVKSSVSEADLKANLDPKPGQGLPEKPKKPAAQAPPAPPKKAASADGGATPLFQKEVSKATGAVEVKVDLKGAKELYLVVHEGPDSFTADWTDWIEPTLFMKDGKKQKLTDLRWKTATTGWGGVVINRNAKGEDMRVEGLPAGKSGRLLGFGTHANSVIAFDLPEGAERFEARVALDKGGVDQGHNNKVVAMVFTAAPAASAIATNGKSLGEKAYGMEAARPLMKDFKTPAGLEATLFAAEPLVRNPTNMDIDPRGRIWIAECVNYRKWSNIQPDGDRIVILEDTKGTGEADKDTTFYQSPEMINVLGLCVLPDPGGKGTRAIVSANGHLWLLTDADGDDKAESAKKMLKIGGASNHDHHVHAVVFGPDGKYYFNFGNNGTDLADPDTGEVLHDIYGKRITNKGEPYRQGMIFRCDIDLDRGKVSRIETLAHNFRNNYEVCVDSFGGMWQSDNDDDGNKGVRINAIVDYGSYGYVDEFTGAGWKTARTNIEKEIPLQHWHQNDPGTIPNLLQTGQGSPTGICLNEGAGLGKRFTNELIHCDAGPRTVRAYPVKKAGAGYTAEMVDILTTDDTWYRPADCAIAPDGSLFVADWYDPGVGGHNMGDNDPKTLRGRVYRVAAKGTSYKVSAPDFSTAEGCANALLSPNNSTQYVAYQKLRAMDAKAEDALKTVWASANPRYRARALHLLLRLPGNFETYLEKAFADENADIRVTAARELRLAAATQTLPASIKDVAGYLLPHIKTESNKQVLREHALTLHIVKDTGNEQPSSAPQPAGKNGKEKAGDKPADTFAAAWVALAKKHDGKDRWYLEALGIGSAGREDRVFQAWLQSAGDDWNTAAGRDIIWRVRTPLAFPLLTKLLADKKADESALPRYLRGFDFLPDGDAKNTALLQAAEGNTTRIGIETDILHRLSRTALKNDPKVTKVLEASLAAAKGKPGYLDLVEAFDRTDKMKEVLDGALSQPKKPGAHDAIKFLIAQQQDGMKLLRATLNSPQAEPLIGLLGGLSEKQAVTLLSGVVSDEKQAALLRIAAVKSLALTSGGALELVTLAEGGKLAPDLKSAAQSALAMVLYPSINERIAAQFPPAQVAGGKALPPIPQLVKLKGDVAKGKAIYAKAESSCILCHRAGNVGVDFAPALSEIGSKLGKDAIYDSILNPNAGLSMGFETTELKLKNGVSALGIVRSEVEGNVVLVLPGGVTNTFKKDQIAERKKLTVSMMPTGLQALFSQEDFVSLVEYLFSLKSPPGKVAAEK